MLNNRDYIEALAKHTAALNTEDWTGAAQHFTLTLDTMAKDAQRWLDNEWAAPNGSTTPAERAVVVLTQDLIVLLGHSANANVKYKALAQLAQAAIEAANSEIIVDQQHRDYFTHPESPLHGILGGDSTSS